MAAAGASHLTCVFGHTTNRPTGLQNDGFWERIIGGPFKEHRSRKALELLHLLIGACMMRHSKGQVRGGGTTPTK